MQRSLDWNLIQSFLAVARAGTLTIGARNLKVDHATLRRHISALEESLATKLFDREISGYRLTIQGQELLARAEEIESAVFGVQTDIGQFSSRVSGTVRIGAPDGFGTAFLAPLLGELAEAHPGLDIELVATPRNFSLSKREADIAIGLSRPTSGRLSAYKLTDYELGVYGARAYEKKWSSVGQVADLARFPFIGYIDDLVFAPELDYLPQISSDITPRLRSSNLIAQMQATIAGAGICVLPCFLAETEPRLVRILADQVTMVRTFWLVMHTDMRELARIRATANFISDRVHAESARFLPDHAAADRRETRRPAHSATAAAGFLPTGLAQLDEFPDAAKLRRHGHLRK